jgi:predicted RNA-binding Zn ribbon-like protein
VLREHLESCSDLERWFKGAGIWIDGALVTEEILTKSRNLRELIYRLAIARAFQRPMDPKDAKDLNEFAARPAAYGQLSTDGAVHLRGTADELVGYLARQAVEILGERKGRIKQCGGEYCAVLFLDSSRGGGRRWCSMQACGNRAKVASFRSRKSVKSGLD